MRLSNCQIPSQTAEGQGEEGYHDEWTHLHERVAPFPAGLCKILSKSESLESGHGGDGVKGATLTVLTRQWDDEDEDD